MNNQNYTYIGCFFNPDILNEKIKHLNRTPLYKSIANPHVTFIYKPEKSYEELFGEEINAVITGYANNGKNEGVSVRVFSENKTLQKIIDSIEAPHITLSVSKDGDSYDTRLLSFEPIDNIEIKGVFKGFIKQKP